MTARPISRGCATRAGSRSAQATTAPRARTLKLMLMLTLVMADHSEA
jgi:hypothetical protein